MPTEKVCPHIFTSREGTSYCELAQRSSLSPEAVENKWLIWSNEHELWWAPDSKGYVADREQAGRYSLADAKEICQDQLYRRKLHNRETGIPAEIMSPSPELIDALLPHADTGKGKE